MNMELWYTENQTENVNFSMKVKNHLYSAESDFQKISLGGAISYIKISNIDKTSTSLEDLIRFIYDNIQYVGFDIE